jgi:hypothetical protein
MITKSSSKHDVILMWDRRPGEQPGKMVIPPETYNR